ncbi:MAG: hypothetical protein Q9191_004242 [Dirinaria sp. TL-2023a]
MPHSTHEQALVETTKRLLSHIVNERLVGAAVDSLEQSCISLFSIRGGSHRTERCVQVTLSSNACVYSHKGQVVSFIRPEMLRPPIIIIDKDTREELLAPDVVFRFLNRHIFSVKVDEPVMEEMAAEMRNSVANQGLYIIYRAMVGHTFLTTTDTSNFTVYHVGKSASSGSPDSSGTDSVSLIYTIRMSNSKQFHRLCRAQPPMEPVTPKDLPEMLSPKMAFVSVLKTEMRIFGPFENTLEPLLARLGIANPPDDRVIIPCLSLQLPCVYHYFPSTILVKSIAECADTQASMRTLTLRPELAIPYHLKLSIACQIGSDVRAIRPCQTLGGQIVRDQLYSLMPEELWLFREIAAVAGAQEDEDIARNLSCIIREDLEPRARANGETLIIAGALGERPLGSNYTHAEIVFHLKTIEEKQDWFMRFVHSSSRSHENILITS